MAVVNLRVCLVIVLFQFSFAFCDEGSSESSDLLMSSDSRKDTVTDGVRCYCNTAQCVSTGYMCRAPGGSGCYSELPSRKRQHHARHGCVHHLADTEAEALSRCQNSPYAGGPPSSADNSLLLCCFQDLCNHEDSPLARARLNMTANDAEGSAVATEKGASFNSEVWFKAAIIAVPVCGALILFILVAVAVRLLKADAAEADRKLRGGYMSPLAQHNAEDVKKVWVGTTSTPLLVTSDGCLVAVERAQLVERPPCQQFCDIQR